MLHGDFLKKVEETEKLKLTLSTRLFEEEFLTLFELDGMGKLSGDWKSKIIRCKECLVENLDFNSISETLENINFFIESWLTATTNKHIAIRGIYFCVSVLFIKIDYLMKDMAFKDEKEKMVILKDGFKYGRNDTKLIKQLIDVLKEPLREIFKVDSSALSAWVDKELDSEANTIISEYFAPNKSQGVLFELSKKYLEFAYSKTVIAPKSLDVSMKSPLLLLMDYFGFDRKRFND